MTGLSNVTRKGGREREGRMRKTDKEGMGKVSAMLQKRGETEREYECVQFNGSIFDGVRVEKKCKRG